MEEQTYGWIGRGLVVDRYAENKLDVIDASLAHEDLMKYFKFDGFYTQCLMYHKVINSPHFFAITPTGYGKTTILAAAALFCAAVLNEKVAIVATNAEKAQLIVDAAIDLLQTSNKDIADGLINTDIGALEKLKQSVSKSGLSWASGGSISITTASEARKNSIVKGEGAIGKGADRFIVDETALISDDNYRVAVRRRADNPDKVTPIAEITNPHQMNHAHETYMNPDVDVIHIDWKDAYHEGRLTDAHIKATEAVMPRYTREWKIYMDCEWQKGNDNSLFTKIEFLSGSIDEALTESKPMFFAGLDSSYKGSDEMRLLIHKVVDDQTELVFTANFNPVDWSQYNTGLVTIKKIVEVAHEWDVITMAVDAGGNGSYVVEMLQLLKPKFEVLEILFGSKPSERSVYDEVTATDVIVSTSSSAYNKRAEMYLQLQKILSLGYYVPKEHRETLSKQLYATEREYRNGKTIIIPKEKIIAKTGSSPDFADAAVLAIEAAESYTDDFTIDAIWDF